MQIIHTSQIPIIHTNDIGLSLNGLVICYQANEHKSHKIIQLYTGLCVTDSIINCIVAKFTLKPKKNANNITSN